MRGKLTTLTFPADKKQDGHYTQSFPVMKIHYSGKPVI